MTGRIYIDISAAVHSRAGLGRYCERLARAIIATDPKRYAIFYNYGSSGRLPGSMIGVYNRSVRWGYKPWRSLVLAGHLAHLSYRHLVRDAELFHATEHLLIPLRGVPTVLTVHDLIFQLFPEYHKKLNHAYLNWAMPLFCERADAIIAISEATKRDLMAAYNVPADKVTVIYEAAAELFAPPSAEEIASVRQRYDLPEQFLIHLSVIEPRKNLLRLLDALKRLRLTHPNLNLVLVGSRGWLYDDFFAKIESEGLNDAVQPLGWVPDQDLPAVIAAATLAVQPSLYEGFGLPILEHMATGQVVAASSTSSHPEIGGDAALYFDPTNVDDMVAVIGRILNDPDEYAHRRELGLKQAAQFSWDRTARETIAIYDRLLQSRS
ncbi:MAG: glycosyltransferase family 4 protein [Anaerolineae bacterium]|nr:glycosyltransferase family 4 protein [Anaerolineae bacterium]MCO5193481.1 glycosyltransferase family 4 protein [Anaerolineae bacterium]